MPMEKIRTNMTGFGPVINEKNALKVHTFAVHLLDGSNGKIEKVRSI
jgi:hypothetical protein